MVDYNSLLVRSDPIGEFQNARRVKQQNALADLQVRQAQGNYEDKQKAKNALAAYFDAPPDQRTNQLSNVYQASPEAATNLMQFQGGLNSLQRDDVVRKLMAIKTSPDPKTTLLANHPDFVKALAANGHDVAAASNDDILKDVDMLLTMNGHPQQQTIGNVNDPSRGVLQRDPMTGALKQVVAPQKPERESSDIQGFNLARSQGFRGSFLDYQRNVANARDTKNDRTQIIQTVDPDTNKPIYKLVDSNTGATINPNVGDVAPKGGANGLGGREGVMFQRVINSANSATEALKNIAELPVGASTGWVGIGASPGTSLLSSVKGVLTNRASSQEVQDYNTMLAGVGRNLATIETAGLAPNGSLTHSMDSIQLREGDTHLTKLRKLAEMRQIIIKGIETNNANPKLPQEQKDLVNGIIDQVKTAIPFTQSDITKLQQKQSKDPSYTFQDLMKEKGLAQAAPQSSNLPNTNSQGWVLHQDAQGNKAYVSPDGKQFQAAQ